MGAVLKQQTPQRAAVSMQSSQHAELTECQQVDKVQLT